MVSDDENEPSYTSTTLVKLPPNEQGVESPSNEQLEENKEQGDKAKKLSKCTRLYGRTSERRQLLQAYQSSHTSELRSAVVLIKGPAGIGKTALVTSLKEELQRDKGHMLTWKCDRHTLLQIASGFAAAIQNLADDVLARSDDELDAMKQRLRQKLDATQVAMMIKAYPPLEPLLDTQDYPTQRDQEYGYDWSAFKCFIGSLCSLKSPMVYFVDDFQWVEPNALTIMMERAHNVQLQGALFVLTYNSDLEDTDSNWYQEIQTLKQKNYVDVTEIILVKNLDERATSSMVSDILRVPKDHNVLINEWIYRQTKGNPLYIEELMHGLYEKGVLAVDNDANSWTFNQEQAGLHCGGCNNVSEYLSMKLKALPRSLQEVLKVASCLGYRFTPKLVSSAMSGSVTTYLDSAKQAGLVTDHRDGMRSRSWQTGMEPKDNKEWHFIHNSMQEAAVLLVGGHSEQASFHLAIGRKLFKVLNEEELKDDLLTVLGHVIIGSGAIKSKEEKYRFAQLALMAARKCVKLTSFKSAHKSLSFAIGLLSERSWREDYDLTLAIYNAAAEVAYAKGDFELAEQMVAEVMKGGRTFDDKLQANTTKLYALGSMNRSSEAIALGLELLKELGESFPTKPNKWHFQYSILTTRWLLKGKSDETLLRSPSMSDCRTVSAMQILNIMFTAALFDKPMLAPLLAMRMVQLSLKHGFCAASCLAFSTYGMLLVSNGVNVDQGTRMGDLGMKLLDRFQAKEWIPRVYAAVYGFIHGWTRPNQLAFEPLLRGYRVALETGDIESAMINVSLYMFLSFGLGKPLAQLEAERILYIEEAASRHENSTVLMYFPLFGVVYQLMGIESEPERPPNALISFNWAEYQKVTVAFILCDYEEAVKVGRQCSNDSPYEGFDIAMFDLFFGLANVAFFKQTGKRDLRLLADARRSVKRIDRICKHATDYCLGKLSLLQAELSSLSRRKHQNTVRKYMIAIALADSKKRLFEGAVAHERYGRYLAECGEAPSSLSHLGMACSLYREWNAYRKVDMLQDEIDKMVAAPRSAPYSN